MYWLRLADCQVHPHGHAPGSFQLPCPTTDLLEVALTPAQDDDGDRIHQLLRCNPSLLIAALHAFFLDRGYAANRADTLVRWCGLKSLAQLVGAVDSVNDTKMSFQHGEVWLDLDFWQAFLRVRKHSKLRRFLNQWLKRSTSLKKSVRGRLLDQILAKSFRADQFSVHRLRRPATCQKILQAWETTRELENSMGSVLRLSAGYHQLEREFSDRLLEAKLNAMKQLAYGASHEINNPLANIATRAQAMMVSEANPQQQHRLSVIYQQAMRAHEMISDLMLFAHPPSIKPKVVSLRLLMNRFVRQWSEELQSDSRRCVELYVTFAPGLDRSPLDPDQFLVALGSLVRNSAEAIAGNPGSGGRIEIKLSATPTGLEVSVWDDGMGIDETIASHVFDPFFSGREAGRGLGFGLPKAWRIAQLHGGQLVRDESCPDGTRFVIQLPASLTMSGDRGLSLAANDLADSQSQLCELGSAEATHPVPAITGEYQDRQIA